MARGDAVFRATVRGYRRTAGRLSRAGRTMQPVILAEFRGQLSRDALTILRDHAPEETGALKREMTAPVFSRGGVVRVTVRSPVRDPQSRYPYTPVTRFGHRRRYIVPRRAKFLRFFWRKAGHWVMLERVRGQHPASDWVRDAEPQVLVEVDRAGERIARVVTSRIL